MEDNSFNLKRFMYFCNSNSFNDFDLNSDSFSKFYKTDYNLGLFIFKCIKKI